MSMDSTIRLGERTFRPAWSEGEVAVLTVDGT